MDEDAASFFATLEQNPEEIDAGAADFFATLNSGVDGVATAASVAESKTGSLAAAHHTAPTAMMINDPDSDDEPLRKTIKTEPKSHVKKEKVNVKHEKKEKSERLRAMKKEIEPYDGPPLPMEERIVNLLVPDMKVSEITQLIKKLRQAGKSESDEFSSQDVQAKTAPRFICDYCGNIEQNNFVTDYARGDTICTGKDGMGCGNVVQDHIVHEGSAYRKFEGEEDKSHHGPAPNKLFSSGHNLRTLISTEGALAGNLRRAAEFVEMNLSQMGKDERRTRIGYKDQMKKKACSMIDHAASNLDLHEIVVRRSKELFAQFRDYREHVHKVEAVVAGCILASYIETQKEIIAAQAKGINPDTLFKLESKSKPVDEKTMHPFQCNLCGLTFNAKRGLQFHNCDKKEDKAEPKNGKRTIDLSPINLEEKKYAPVIEVVNSKRWFKCPICPRKFMREDGFGDHIDRHKNQSKKRKTHIETSTMDSTRFPKTNSLSSANPSVQVNTHEKVLFRGVGRRPWIQQILKNDSSK